MVDAETKPAMSVMGETRRTRCGVTWGYLACYSLGAVRHCQMRPITLPQTFIHVSVRAFHAPTIRYVLLCSCEGSTLSEKF
jgi:hypothetical protein